MQILKIIVLTKQKRGVILLLYDKRMRRKNNQGGENVSEGKKKEILDGIKEALGEVPEEFHEDVAQALTHDIGVMVRTIKIVGSAEKETRPG